MAARSIIQMNPELASAGGLDASGNSQMRRAGRESWNAERKAA
jgi:hypothetical protein